MPLFKETIVPSISGIPLRLTFTFDIASPTSGTLETCCVEDSSTDIFDLLASRIQDEAQSRIQDYLESRYGTFREYRTERNL